MLKKLLILGLTGLLIASAYFYWNFSNNRTLITPYPYHFLNSFDSNFLKTKETDIQTAENAKILIVGDRMGKSLDPYLEGLKEQFSDVFKAPPTIFNWSAENEGLFRTVHKLKKLKKLPPIVIYYGASSELQEQKFSIVDKEKILQNFLTFDDEKMISLIITFPWLSKILYKNINYYDLSEFKEYKNSLAANQKLEEKELSFKIFSYEVRELIDLIKYKQSNLIIITTPLNLEVEPKEVCDHAENVDIIEVQQEISSLISSGSFKEAFPKALELSETTFSNARSYYLLGRSALGAGDLKTAREALLKASVFDCSNWRGNAVYNAILKDQAKKNQISVVDFEQFMNSKLSEEGLFQDEIIPQNIFYKSMMKELEETLKRLLSVNQ